MPQNLSKTWRKWSKARFRELVAKGIDRETAHTWAGREAMARQDGENLIGRQAAMDADLLMDFRPGGFYSIYLKISVDEVPPDRLPAARAWATASTFSCAAAH